jgi:hypothetical protein
MRRGLNNFAAIRPDLSFDMEAPSVWPLEPSNLGRMNDDVGLESPKLLTHIEETDNEFEDETQSAASSAHSDDNEASERHTII